MTDHGSFTHTTKCGCRFNGTALLSACDRHQPMVSSLYDIPTVDEDGWVEVEGFSIYKINRQGQIRNTYTGREVKHISEDVPKVMLRSDTYRWKQLRVVDLLIQAFGRK